MDEPSTLSDEKILELSLTNPALFEFLVARYQRQFLARAQAVVGSRDVAEDVMQDAFVRMYRFATRFRGEAGSFRAWGLTILMNVARTYYQKSARERGMTAVLDPEFYETFPDPASLSSGEEEAFAKETITAALGKAPPEVARILKLAFLDDLPYKDIAEREGLTVAAVKTRVFRAKAVLRTIISKSL
jgi:RNA polymerase sigma-70 factor (ECF subfamily)